MQMHRVLTRAKGIIPRDHPDFETALEAERDLQVLAFVFEQTVTLGSDSGRSGSARRWMAAGFLRGLAALATGSA